MRRKNDKSANNKPKNKGTTRREENVYDKSLTDFDNLGRDISRHIQPTHKDAATVQDMIARYRKLSKALEDHKSELDSTQVQKLVAIRAKYENTIEGIRIQLPRLVKEQIALDEKNAKGLKEQREREANVKAQCDALVLQLANIATEYVKAPVENMEELLTQYNQVKSQLQHSASDIPVGDNDNEGKRLYTVTSLKGPDKKVEFGTAFKELRVLAEDHHTASDRTRKQLLSEFRKKKTEIYKGLKRNFAKGSEEFTDFLSKVTTLDQEVKIDDKKADELKWKKEIALQKMLEKNRRKMEEITQSAGLVGALLSIAPKNIQDGLNYLASNLDIINALEHDKGVKLALGDVSLQEGFKQITDGVVDGTIATVGSGGLTQVNSLSAEKQLAVIDAAIKALTAQGASTPEAKKAVEALQFMRRTVVDMQRLANKEVSHISFALLSQDGKSVLVTHLGVSDALNNPASLLQVVNSLGGVDSGNIHIVFSNPQQAALLSMLAQQNLPNVVGNMRAALERANTTGALTQGSAANALVQVFNGALTEINGGVLPQVNTLGGIIDLVLLASGNNNAMAQLFGTNVLVIQKRLELINEQFKNQTNVAVTSELMLTLVDGLGAILMTLNQIPQLKTGPIADYYNSHLNPNRFIGGGTAITVVDQSLTNNPEALSLLAGGDVQQLENGESLAITPPLVSEDEQRLQKQKEEEQRQKQKEEQQRQRIQNLANSLAVQKAEYISLLHELGMVITKLYDKEEDDASYSTVTKVALELHDKLEDASVFFSRPTPEGFRVFVEANTASIKEAMAEFENHRGLWHTIPLIIRGLLGVIAALIVVPALAVTFGTKDGYTGTFFSTPTTQSAKELADIQATLANIEKEIEAELAAHPGFLIESAVAPR
ncbi:hypothetical protein [Legionella fallonii]|uniref:Coiled-coil-containing protein n=1 Tax=Legionella fallonii LLAP-10 TaxID=1212491 RepID=A0A098G6B3_9GAMM|nr:hypothetical protein [Legionella fallonii]CEG57050.1 protein of unknown function [Legionella fallonii LLAP-10]